MAKHACGLLRHHLVDERGIAMGQFVGVIATGGGAGRLQNEIGSGEAGGLNGAIDQRLIIGRDAQVPAEARGGSHG
jgi:hypothetical protein